MKDWDEIDEEDMERRTVEEERNEYKRDEEIKDDTEEQESDSLSQFNWFNTKNIQKGRDD